MNNAEIVRRIRILEGAIGIDLDSTDACSGNPDDCEADPCCPERCPLFNNTVQQMFRKFGKTSEEVLFLKTLVDLLEIRGDITPEVIKKTHLTVQLNKTVEEIRQNLEISLTVVGGIVNQTFQKGLHKLQLKKEKLQRELDEC